MAETALEQWKSEALALPARDFVLRQPVYVAIGEAHDLAAMAKRYWKTRYSKDKEILEPGLELAGARLKASWPEQLRSRADALQQAHSAYLLATGAQGRKELMERASLVVGEIKAVLDWYFDDGVEDEKDAKLASVTAEHEQDPATPDALASELNDYATLASEHSTELDGLGGFDVAMLEEARQLAAQLLALPADPSQSPDRAREREALDLRNRIAWLLQQQASTTRAAARFVFRNHPEIAKLFTSTYERKKRAAARRTAKPSPTPS